MADNPQADPALVKLFKDALARQSRGDRNGAVIAYKRIQRQFPEFTDAWINASMLLCEMGRVEEALDMALRALELAPESSMAIYALGFARLCLGHMDEAANCLRSAIERDPKHALALNSLADIYTHRGDLAGALELRDRAVEALPSFSLLWGRRGNTKMLMLDMAGAEADLVQTLEMDANNVYARSNLQYIQQLQHRYREAWSHLRSGHLSMDFFTSHRYDFGKPHWNSEPLNGRTLLIYAQRHGFGNTIQFARFFQQIQRQYGGRVVLLTYEPLKRLLTNAPGLDGLVIDGEPLPDFDLVVPEASLLVILNADPSDFPPPIQIFVEHRPMPEIDRLGFKVGLVWGGSPGHERNAKRSINPRLLDELADISGIAWYGLQKPPSAEPPKLPGFIDMSPYMGDFMDTAQIIKQLDLIVTVDTAMAHLAGSLGLPTIVLLEYLPDWRWGLGEHTPWYPTLTLLRQTISGDWRGVISLLKQRINEFATSKKTDAVGTANNPQTDPALVKLFKDALIRQSQGDRNGAVIAYKRIQRQFPDFADAWINAAILLCEMGRTEEALDMTRRAIELAPEDSVAIYALGFACLKLGNIYVAENCMRRVIERDPEHVPALTYLAGICVQRGNLTEALELNDRAIQLQPTHAILWERRGHTKARAFDLAGAEEDLIQALKLDPDNILALFLLGYILPLQSRYREGWVHLNAILKLNIKTDFGKPYWNGKPLNGGTLLVYSNGHEFGGYGDVIQFSRFLPQIKQLCGGRVILYIYESLKRLMTNVPGIDEIMGSDEPLPDFDAILPFSELPSILDIDLLELPPPTQIMPEYTPAPLPELDRPGFKVGLVWAGSPQNSNGITRDITPSFFDELADIQGIAWYGLQIPPSADPPKLPGFIDMSPYMGDFMDTAQIVRQLDLFVTVDTSMAHLAGSLGVPTIVLLQLLPDWRWGLNSPQTPWYETVTLLRQSVSRDWREVIGTLKHRITELVMSKTSDTTGTADNPQADPALVKLFKDALSRQSRGDKNGAVIAYKRIQRQFPEFTDAWINAAMLLCEMGRVEESLAAAERAISLGGGDEVSFFIAAEGHHRLWHIEEALKHYAKVIECNPGHVPAMLRMAEICFSTGLFERALVISDMALRHDPGNVHAHFRNGMVRLYLMDYSGAEADFRRVLEMEPDYAIAHQSLTFVLLMTGRYSEGWKHQRASGLGFWGTVRHDFGKPHWKGEPLEGRTLLVYGQSVTCGRGDNIQFARFFPLIKERYGCRIVLYAFESQKRLFEGMPGLDDSIADGEPLPHFDATVPVWELPSIIDIELSDLPPPAAIMPGDQPPPLPELDRPGFKIGLTWASGNVGRMLDPRLLDELADVPGVAWYGFQVPPSESPPKLPGFIDMSPRMGDFLDTAQIARQMDLVVTVDTAMAHLAGSLGVSMIVMIFTFADWRWGQGETADWYPTARLLRQPLGEGPESVVRALKAEIARRV